MAKFLSEVTLSRLDSRREDTDRTNSETLVCLDEPVLGFIRCAQVAAVGVSTGGSLSTNRSVWCGEQDGAIIVRDLDSQQATVVIERKPNTLVFSMCAPSENRLWAGLNDGHVRVFDTVTYHLVEEFKVHCSAVTAMAVANMPTNDDQYEHHMHVVVTCSTDWTIAKWDAVSYACLGRLQGHSNAVKCICPSASGEYLVSGGMDGSVRLWSLISNAEATAQRLGTTAAASSKGATPNTGDGYGDGRSPSSVRNTVRGGGGSPAPRLRASSVASSSASSPSTEAAYHHRDPANVSAWPLLGLHSDTVTCVLIVRDEYIVSGGSEGSVHLTAFDASGKWLQELERRPCAVTSILHDSVNSRLWVAGVDGVISLYRDEYPAVTPLTRVHDHSGVYVMSLTPMERGNLFRFLVVDDEGQLTKFVESDHALRSSSNFELGAVSQQELLFSEEIDHLRGLVVRSYNELQSLRRELKAIEAHERRRKRGMTVKLGDAFQLKQRVLYSSMRWILRQRYINITKRRCDWMCQSNALVLRGNRYASWLLWFRQRRNERRKQTLVMTMRAGALHKSKTDVAYALADAARRVESKGRMRTFMATMTSQSDRGRLLMAYARWSAFALDQRHRSSQMAVARAVAQSVDDATAITYWNRLVQLARDAELIHRKVRVVESVVHASGRGLLAMYFRQWAREAEARRRDGSTRRQQLARQLEGATVVQQAETYSSRKALVHQYFTTWLNFRVDMQCQREVEIAVQADRERELWEEVLAETASPQAQELTLLQADDIQKQFDDRVLEIEAQDAAMKELRRQLFETKRDILCKGLVVPQGLAVRDKLRTILMYLKGKGVSTYADVATIALAKDAFSVLPLLPPPDKKGAGGASTSPLRNASPVRSTGGAAAKPKPKAKPAASAAAAAAPAAPKPQPPTLGSTFTAILKKLRATVSAACLAAGLTPHGVDRGGGRVRSTSLLKRDAGKAQHLELERRLAAADDWGILPGWVAKLKKKDQTECLVLVKQLCILSDTIDAKLAEPSAQLGAAQQAIQAAGPSVTDAACIEFVYNSHVIMELSQVELQTRGALAEYVKQQHLEVAAAAAAAAAAASPADDPEPSAAAPPAPAPGVTRSAGASGSPQRPPSRAPSPKTATPRRPGAPAAAAASPPPPAAAAAGAKSRSPTPSARKSIPSPSPAPAPKPSGSPRAAAMSVAPKPYLGLRVAPKKTGATTKLLVDDCPESYAAAAAAGTSPARGDMLDDPRAEQPPQLPGPAFAAGLRVGDELVRFANYVVTDLASFNAIVARHAKIGQQVPVQYRRGASVQTAVVVVGSK